MSMQVKYPKAIHSKVPIDSFIQVTVLHHVKPDKCLPQKKMQECNSFIAGLPMVSNRSTGSGVLISHNNSVHILTAAHVCTVPLLTETVFKGFKFGLKNQVSISVTLQGGSRFKSSIVAINKEDDLCLLKPPAVSNIPSPIHLSPTPPSRGDRIINIAAPLGITGANLTLIFHGYYSGHLKEKYYYTVPARPGSSGSVILNNKFQAIGTLNIAVIGLENVGIGTGWLQLKEFLDKNSKKK